MVTNFVNEALRLWQQYACHNYTPCEIQVRHVEIQNINTYTSNIKKVNNTGDIHKLCKALWWNIYEQNTLGENGKHAERHRLKKNKGNTE